jgi:hypothetical protein
MDYNSILFYSTGPTGANVTSETLGHGKVTSGANDIKLFTAIIYCHSIVILPFYVIKLYNLVNEHGMAVNYQGKKFYNNGPWWQT